MTLEISHGITSETDAKNITLMCSITDGDPLSFSSVHWYFEEEPIHICGQADDIDYSEQQVIEDFFLQEETVDSESYLVCDENNSGVLVVTNVDRRFMGKWECAGENIAGLGDKSLPQYLDVLCKEPISMIFFIPLFLKILLEMLK